MTHSQKSDVSATTDSAVARGAGLHWRFLALIYDLFPLAAICFAGSALVYALNGVQPVEPGSWQGWLELLFLLALCFGYYGISWRRGGQTLGMRAWRLRLESLSPGAASWRQLAVRWLVAWPSLLLGGAGYWIAWFDPQRRCWPDRVSDTRVRRLPRA